MTANKILIVDDDPDVVERGNPEDIVLQHVDVSIKLDRLCYGLEHAY